MKRTASPITMALCACVLALLVTPIRAAAPETRARHSPCQACVSCGTTAATPRVALLRVYNQSRLNDTAVATVLENASRLWQPYGVTLASGSGEGAISLVIRTTPQPDDKWGHKTMGTTLFFEGHATPYIQLSLEAAEQVAADARTGDVTFVARPFQEREAILLRMMGVALAHELGHYLLDTRVHSADGLLRRALAARDFEYPESARLTLTGEQQALICRKDAAPAVR